MRATTLTDALTASISYDHAGRATSRTSSGIELDGFVHDTLDRLTTIRRNGTVSEILEYAPTGELAFRKLGTQGTWYVGSVGTVTATVAAGCLGIDTITVPLASRCVAAPGTVKVTAHVQVAGGRVASIRAAAGSGTDAVSEVLYYHRDMQGSVVATSYRSGGLSGYLGARYRYLPYGQLDRAENVTATTDSELGYTGGLRLWCAGSWTAELLPEPHPTVVPPSRVPTSETDLQSVQGTSAVLSVTWTCTAARTQSHFGRPK